MPRIEFSRLNLPSADKEFDLNRDRLASLEVRAAPSRPGFHFFYDKDRRQLVTDFVLQDRPKTALMCGVTLIGTEDGFSPRLRLWIKDKSKSGRSTQMLDLVDVPGTRQIKAAVDASDAHENVWKLIRFLQTMQGVSIPEHEFRLVDVESADLADLLRSRDRVAVIEAVRATIGGTLTEADISLMSNRKQQLAIFERLLSDSAYFRAASEKHHGPERAWQAFFESNQWIFGYGLKLVANESLNPGRLERYIVGADVLGGSGKEIDALMRSRGYMSTLLLCEIKSHDTDLLARTKYREQDIYVASKDLSGAVAQVQKTTRKAVRKMSEQLKSIYRKDGEPTGEVVSTTRPRQVVVIGSLSQLGSDLGANPEKIETFELFRTSLVDTEILTFDELYERARYIVEN